MGVTTQISFTLINLIQKSFECMYIMYSSVFLSNHVVKYPLKLDTNRFQFHLAFIVYHINGRITT